MAYQVNSIFQAGGALSVQQGSYITRRADGDALQAILGGEYVHIIAPRQLGKTSLLKRLNTQLTEIGWRCAYVDLATLMGLVKPEWYTELGRELADTLTPGMVPSLKNQLDLRRYLLDVALPWLDAKSYVVLFLDEVEGASKVYDENGRSFSDTFFMVLRNLYNQRDSYKGTLVVVLAGAVSPTELVQEPAISPFNVGQEVSLDDFSPTETKELTQHLTEMEVLIDLSVHETIYAWTSGHPYLTQRVCIALERRIRDHHLVTITPEVVTAVIEQTLLNPANPLQHDSNIRHVSKMLNHLSAPAARLWSRLQTGEIVTRQEAVSDLYLELYLTGAVKAENECLVIRNPIYEKIFTSGYQGGQGETATNESIANNTAAQEIHQVLLRHFNLEDLRTLCFDLNLEYDDLKGEGRAAKARELVKQMLREQRLPYLQTAIKRARPTVRWSHSTQS